MAIAPATPRLITPEMPRHVGSDVELGCYSQMYTERAEVLSPADVAELVEIVAEARADDRHITLRAGENAFDAQSLGSDMVISLKHLNAIGDVFDDGGDECITVGAGARLGDILAKVVPLGLVPAVMVTTENATAGGTLSGNCLSRFSPTLGKEGGWVKRFELLTVQGRRLTCTPPDDDQRPETWTREERAYMAAIGGLGYIGVVYEITYKLVRAYDPSINGAGALAVKTRVTKHKTYDHLAESLVRQAHTMCRREVPEGVTLADDPENQAIYSGLIRRLNGRQSAIVMTSTYTTDAERKPMSIHQPASAFRFIAELLLRTRVGWLLSLFGYHVLFSQRRTYIDDLRGFTFFMDGNARTKAWGKRHGIRMPTVQQTFVIPFDPDAHFHSDEEAEKAGCKKLADWLDESDKLIGEHRVSPAFSDVLFVRDTKPFGLSSNAGKSGFAVSYAFETSSKRKLARIEQAFAALADKLADPKYDGRVYLVKNVYASQETLRKMYGEHAIGFLKVKRELDPSRLLVNDFFDRTFGDLCDEVYAGAHDEATAVRA